MREITAALSRLIGAAAHVSTESPPAVMTASTLGGAELLMRTELLAGRAERMAAMLPAFAYLVTLPYLGQEEALHLQRRTGELIESGSG